MMTDPIRAAETLAASCRSLLEEVARMGDCIGKHTVGEITAISDRVAAWLRENPLGQVAQSAPPAEGEPSDEELDVLANELLDCTPEGIRAFARAALARYDHQPAPPAEGEVGELVAWLRGQNGGIGRRAVYSRIADLLEQRHPTPVPVSERLPGPEDCDAEGRCWWGAPALSGTVTGSVPHSWRLCRPEDRFGSELVWLPAAALPLPAGELPP